MSTPFRWLLLGTLLALGGCQRPYRVGERVLVEWVEDAPPYPAFIVEQKGPTRFRVHFDGYATRWDRDVGLDKIVGRARADSPLPPPPREVARVEAIESPLSGSATPMSPYRPGDRVRVRWRDSVYPATVLAVEAADRLLVHYDGHEAAWDEVVSIDRVVGRR